MGWVTTDDGEHIFIGQDGKVHGGQAAHKASLSEASARGTNLGDKKMTGGPSSKEFSHPDGDHMVQKMSEVAQHYDSKRLAMERQIDTHFARGLELEAQARTIRTAHPIMKSRPAHVQAELDKIHEEGSQVYGAVNDLHKQIKESHDQQRQAAFNEVLGSNKPMIMNLDKSGDLPQGLSDMEKGTEIFKTMMGGGQNMSYPDVKLRAIPKDSEHHINQRSYADINARTVHMGHNAGIATTIHEMGHIAEEVEPSIHEAALAFLDRRTVGKPLRKLSEITGQTHFRDNEVARDAGFIHPYVGKDYKGYATEVISMGMEHMYRDPVAFAKADPDHFKLIHAMMKRNG